jgi:hypothetical protein
VLVSEHRAASLPVLCFLPHPICPLAHTGGTCSHLDVAQSRSERRLTDCQPTMVMDVDGRWSSLQCAVPVCGLPVTTHSEWPLVVHLPCQLPTAHCTPQANASHILAILALTLGPSRPRCRNSSRADQVFAGPICGQQTAFGLMPAAALRLQNLACTPEYVRAWFGPGLHLSGAREPRLKSLEHA